MIGKNLAHVVGREERTEQVNGMWCGHWSGASAGIISRDVALRGEKREAKAHDEECVVVATESGSNGVHAWMDSERFSLGMCVDGFACFLLGEAQVVEALQIERKIGRCYRRSDRGGGPCRQ